MNEQPSRQPQGIQSVEVSGLILQALCDQPGPASLKSIADHAGLAPAKAHRYMISLIRIGVAAQDPTSGLYDLGPMARRLGVAAIARDDVIARATAMMRTVATELQTTAHLSVWGDHGPVVIAVEHGGAPVVLSLNLGSGVPLLRSATGRVFYAFMPEHVTAPMLASELALLGEGRDWAATQAADIRQRRVATIENTLVTGLTAVSGAVLNIDNSIACAVTLVASEPALLKPGSDGHSAFVRHIQDFDALG